jgi:hypothetical protein
MSTRDRMEQAYRGERLGAIGERQKITGHGDAGRGRRQQKASGDNRQWGEEAETR